MYRMKEDQVEDFSYLLYNPKNAQVGVWLNVTSTTIVAGQLLSTSEKMPSQFSQNLRQLFCQRSNYYIPIIKEQLHVRVGVVILATCDEGMTSIKSIVES